LDVSGTATTDLGLDRLEDIYLLGAVKFVADAIFIYAAVSANLIGTSELNARLLFFLAAGFITAKLALAAHLFWRFQFPNE